MNCPRCGIELPENATTCPECSLDLPAQPDEGHEEPTPELIEADAESESVETQDAEAAKKTQDAEQETPDGDECPDGEEDDTEVVVREELNGGASADEAEDSEGAETAEDTEIAQSDGDERPVEKNDEAEATEHETPDGGECSDESEDVGTAEGGKHLASADGGCPTEEDEAVEEVFVGRHVRIDKPKTQDEAASEGAGGNAEPDDGEASENKADKGAEAPQEVNKEETATPDEADEDDGPVGMKVRFTPYYDEELAREQASSFDPDVAQEASPFVSLAAGYGTIVDGAGTRPEFDLSNTELVDPKRNTLPAPTAPAAPPAKKKRIKPVAAVIIVAAVAAAIIIGLIWWSNTNQATDAPFVGAVEVTLEIPDYGEGSSPVPIKVSGTTSAQEPLLETFLITPDNNKIELEEGRYHFTAEGSPVTGAGTIFGIPRGDFEVTVGPKGTKVDGKTSSGPTFTYAVLAAENVTDQAVGNIRAWMEASGIPQEEIDAYAASIYAARDARIAQIEEEKRIAAEEKAAAEHLADLKAAVADYSIADTVEADGFSFGMPAAWDEMTETEHYADGAQSVAIVHFEGNPDLKIMEIARYPIADGQSHLLGDGSEGPSAEMETVSSWDSDDWHFEVRACEWPLHLMQDWEYMGCSDYERDPLVHMCTGNRFSFDELGLLDSSYYAGATADMVRNAVVPTIVSLEPVKPEGENESDAEGENAAAQGAETGAPNEVE